MINQVGKKNLAAALIISALSASVVAQDHIPVVPASVMRAAAQEAETRRKDIASRPAVGSAVATGAAIAHDTVLTMEPGVNQIIPIAVGHPNRIVTPFSSPEVLSTSLTGGSDGECGEICIKDNVVYVATDQDQQPVTMFITEKGSQARALSLTMIPRKVPPREVFLKLDGDSLAQGLHSNPQAERWEKNTPYIETLRTVFRKMALGEIPQGYTLNSVPDSMMPPHCDHPGMNVSFKSGQVLMGHSLRIFVGIAENTSGAPAEFQEATCGGWDVAAVTTWPLKVLEPGQKTEVFVAKKIATGEAPTSKRPSLLGGKQ